MASPVAPAVLFLVGVAVGAALGARLDTWRMERHMRRAAQDESRDWYFR